MQRRSLIRTGYLKLKTSGGENENANIQYHYMIEMNNWIRVRNDKM